MLRSGVGHPIGVDAVRSRLVHRAEGVRKRAAEQILGEDELVMIGVVTIRNELGPRPLREHRLIGPDEADGECLQSMRHMLRGNRDNRARIDAAR